MEHPNRDDAPARSRQAALAALLMVAPGKSVRSRRSPGLKALIKEWLSVAELHTASHIRPQKSFQRLGARVAPKAALAALLMGGPGQERA